MQGTDPAELSSSKKSVEYIQRFLPKFLPALKCLVREPPDIMRQKTTLICPFGRTVRILHMLTYLSVELSSSMTDQGLMNEYICEYVRINYISSYTTITVLRSCGFHIVSTCYMNAPLLRLLPNPLFIHLRHPEWKPCFSVLKSSHSRASHDLSMS